MADISDLVTTVCKTIVILFVAVDVSVGASLTSTEFPEVTELETTIIVIPGEDLSRSSQPPVISSSRPPPTLQGKDYIQIRLTLLNYTWKDKDEKLERDIVDQVSAALEKQLADFAGAKFSGFSVSKEENGLEADVKIYFNEKLDNTSRTAAYKILLNLKGEIGTLRVGKLEVQHDDGQMNEFTFCNVTNERCPDGARCVGDESTCTASCKINEGYCLNGGTCQDGDIYIACVCPNGITGDRCEVGGAILSDTARVVVIAVAVVVFLLILLILVFCFIRKCQPCTKPSRELYGIENIVALHTIRDETSPVGGVAIQTDDSFLLNLSYANGVPPKAGYSHKIMQTNESFLLARSQNPKVAQVKAQAHLRQSQNGSPSKSENSNGSREPKSSPQGGAARGRPTQPDDNSKVNAEATQTGGSLPRKIIKV